MNWKLCNGSSVGGIELLSPCRISPEPKDGRFIKAPEAFTWKADASVRTRLVFNPQGRFELKDSQFNAPQKRQV